MTKEEWKVKIPNMNQIECARLTRFGEMGCIVFTDKELYTL